VAREFTDDELRQVAEYVARRYLEVERGLRGRQCLRRFLSPGAYTRQYADAASRFRGGGVVRQSDLGQMVFQRQGNRVFIALPARQEGDRWGALLMELRADARGAWRVTELTRAQDRNLAHPTPASRRTPAEDLDTILVRTVRDITQAGAARAAAADRFTEAGRRLAGLAPEKPAAELRPGDLINTAAAPEQNWVRVHSVTRDDHAGQVTVTTPDRTQLRVPGERPVAVLNVDRGDLAVARQAAAAAADELATTAEELAGWDRQLNQLERERSELVERHGIRRRVNDSRDDPQPPDYITRTLGAPPSQPPAREVWDTAADAIEAYRDRWDISTTDTALGRRPEDFEQRKDRDATVAALRDLASQLNEIRSNSDRLARPGRDTDPEGRNRDPFVVAAPQDR
jgi:hypothetical protein